MTESSSGAQSIAQGNFVGVLGLGSWGTALGEHLARKKLPVIGWTIDEAVVKSINAERRNCLYQSEVTLSNNFTATNQLKELEKCSTIIVALPSHVLAEVVPQFHFTPEQLVISGVKGLEPKSLLTTLQYLKAHSAARRLVALSGPSFATDVIQGRPVGLVAASTDETIAREAAELYSGEWLKVYLSTDPLGVEVGGVVKNIIAVAAGVCAGLGFGDSAQAGLITRGLAQMMVLADAVGAKRETLAGLSGLGDLAMTASSNTSRNRRLGFRLGQGEALSEILRTLGGVAEGVTSTPLVLKLARSHNVELPIAEAVARVLSGEVSPLDMARALMARPIKHEF